jgi:type 1 glutamine amidotransferase
LLLGQKADSHPATTHEYMAGVRLLGLLLERSPGIQTVVSQADSPWKDGPEMLDGADAAIVFLSEGAKWVTEDADRLAAFQRLAKRGGGLTCLHWGMGTRQPEPIADFTALFGACHGGADRKYEFASFAVKPMDGHPVTVGITPIEVRDEFYYSLKQPAPELMLKVAPLLQASIDGTDQTVAWACERPDGGRSFGFSGLHYHENWKLPEYRRLVLQGVLWTLKRDIPKAGISVDVHPEDLTLPSR